MCLFIFCLLSFPSTFGVADVVGLCDYANMHAVWQLLGQTCLKFQMVEVSTHPTVECR